MAGNSNLNTAKNARKDEFYTQLTDIEKELRYYRKHFKDKTILCNCDDPFESNFFKYFVLNFNRLGLKKLIATCYTGSPIANQQLSLFEVLGDSEDHRNRPYKAVVTTVYDKTGDGGVDMLDVAELFRSGENRLTELEGDGDFRSPECLALLDEADIVVTNPPFSLFREYLAVLFEHNKKFLIIGSQNNITYKDVFHHFMHNEMWLGYKAGDMAFAVPDYYEERETRYWQDANGQKWRSLGNICWYTNLDIKKRHEEMILVRRYIPKDFPMYANYNAIEVSKIADIPLDYYGEMGVPITFLSKYNPDQFEIVGSSRWLGKPMSEIAPKGTYVSGGVRFYLPIEVPISQTVNVERERERHICDSVVSTTESSSGERYRRMYDRIVIRNKHPEPPKEG